MQAFSVAANGSSLSWRSPAPCISESLYRGGSALCTNVVPWERRRLTLPRPLYLSDEIKATFDVELSEQQLKYASFDIAQLCRQNGLPDGTYAGPPAAFPTDCTAFTLSEPIRAVRIYTTFPNDPIESRILTYFVSSDDGAIVLATAMAPSVETGNCVDYEMRRAIKSYRLLTCERHIPSGDCIDHVHL